MFEPPFADLKTTGGVSFHGMKVQMIEAALAANGISPEAHWRSAPNPDLSAAIERYVDACWSRYRMERHPPPEGELSADQAARCREQMQRIITERQQNAARLTATRLRPWASRLSASAQLRSEDQ